MHQRLVLSLLLVTSPSILCGCNPNPDFELMVVASEPLCVGQSGTVTVSWLQPRRVGSRPSETELEVAGPSGVVFGPPSGVLTATGTVTYEVECTEAGTGTFGLVGFEDTEGGRRTAVDQGFTIQCVPCDGDAGAVEDAGVADGGPDDGGTVAATPADGVFESVPGTEIPTPSWLESLFGIGSGISAVVAGEGVVIHDMSDGSVAHDLSSAGTAVIYRALPVRSRVGGEIRDSIFGVGSSGYFDRGYRADMDIFGFAFLGANGQNCTDVQGIADPTDPSLTTRFIMVNNTLGQVVSLEADGLDETELMSSTDIAVAGVDGSPVSCHANDDASRMVCNTSTDVFFWDGTDIELVGDGVGTALRLVHCAAGRCVLPDFAGDVLVFEWDGVAAPDLDAATRLPIFGGVSAEVHADGRLAVPSSTAGELHVLTLDSSLAVTEERVCVIDTPATAPHHAAWFPGSDFVLVNHGGDAAIESIDVTTCAAL